MQSILQNVHWGAAGLALAKLALDISAGDMSAAVASGTALLLALGIHFNQPTPTGSARR